MLDFIRFMKHLLTIVHFARGILIILALLLLICAWVIGQVEELSFREAVYLVLITALTIGYGDITPETTWGRVASVAAGMIGMLITGIVIAMAVRALGQAMQEKQQDQAAERR